MAVFFEEFRPSKKFLDSPNAVKYYEVIKKDALEFINKTLQPQQLINITESANEICITVWYKDLTMQEISKL